MVGNEVEIVGGTRSGQIPAADFLVVYSVPWTDIYGCYLYNLANYKITPTLMSDGYMKLVADSISSGIVFPDYILPIIPGINNEAHVRLTAEVKVVTGYFEFGLIANITGYSSDTFTINDGIAAMVVDASSAYADIMITDTDSFKNSVQFPPNSRSDGTVFQTSSNFATKLSVDRFNTFNIDLYVTKNAAGVEMIRILVRSNGGLLCTLGPVKDADFNFRSGISPYIMMGSEDEAHIRTFHMEAIV